MSRNIEIKARIENLEDIMRQVAAISDGEPVELIQDDTFFNCDNGRLKLRTFSDTKGELIFYKRADKSGPKECFYLRSEIPQPALLRETLTLAYGATGRVQKRRKLFMLGRARIHIDQVTDLGDFLEIEVVLDDNESLEKGVEEANELLTQLEVEDSQLIESAYVDLLQSDGN